MPRLLLTVIVVLAIIVLAEIFWKTGKYRTEYTRKFIHITVGTFAAFWPWFLSWDQIILLTVAFFIVVFISRIKLIFGSIHLARRKTYGELFFAVGIGLTAIISHNKLIFAFSILNLSFADGLAAVIGTKYGKKTSYKVFGQNKSMVGTIAFALSSLLILIIYFSVSHAGSALPTLIWLPLVATIFENIGYMGSDNLFVPIVVALALKLVS